LFTRRGGAWRRASRDSVVLPALDLEKRPTATIGAELAGAIRQLFPDGAKRYLPLQVSVPDPLGHLEILILDGVPKTRKACLDLVRWHFEKDAHLDPSQVEFGFQHLGRDDGKFLLLGQALDARWLAVVRGALAEAGLENYSLNMSFSRSFNACEDRVRSMNEGVALVSLHADSWSLGFCDHQARVRFLRSRWRRDGAEYFASIGTEIENAIRAYSKAASEPQIAQVVVMGEADVCQQLADMLNPRLSRPCMVLPATGARETELPVPVGEDELFSFITRVA